MAATLSRQLVLSADGFFILGTRGLHPVPPRGPSTPRSLHPRQLELARWEQGLEDRRPGQLGTKAPVPGASETRRGRPLPPRGRAVTRAVSRTLPSAPAPGGRCGSSWRASGCWRRAGNGAHAAPQAWRDASVAGGRQVCLSSFLSLPFPRCRAVPEDSASLRSRDRQASSAPRKPPQGRTGISPLRAEAIKMFSVHRGVRRRSDTFPHLFFFFSVNIADFVSNLSADV